MAEDHWTYATVEEAYEAADALAHSAGLPRKGTRRTGGRHAPIPPTFTEGAAGWTQDLVLVNERDGGGPPGEAFSVDRIPELTSPHEGATVTHPVHGTIKAPTAKASKKKGAWKKKGTKPKRPKGPKKGGGKKAQAKASSKVGGIKMGPGVGPSRKKKAVKKVAAKKSVNKKR